MANSQMAATVVRSVHARAVFLTVLSVVLGLSRGDAASTDIILRAADATVITGTWSVVSDTTAAGGARIANPDAHAAKLTAPLTSPANYFELAFDASASVGYRLWIRGKAQANSYDNDSVYVQFSDSVTSTGAPTWRINSTSATTYILEECSGCGVSGWGWQDNAYGTGVLGPLVYFQTTGTHTIRIQVREDGLSIDQIVLSPSTYLTTAPGATKNDNTILVGGAPPAVTFVRDPYLQQVFDTTAIVVWATREPGPAAVKIAGTVFPAASTFFPASTTGMTVDYYQHEARISGLTPATTYAYDLYVGDIAVTQGTDHLTTAPPAGTGAVRLVAFGDSGTGSAEQSTLSRLIEGDTFDFALHAGDIAYGDETGLGDATYATMQSWFFDVYRTWLRRRPLFPTNGNHDSRATNGWGAAYLNLFTLPEHGATAAFPDHAERYYSFDYGPAHFVSLDTEFAFQDSTRRAAQLAWIDSDLAATAQPWKVVFFHRSPYSSGGEHGSDLVVRQAFGPLFEKYGVQIVITGHEHDYERLVPWRESADSTQQAVTYIVSGGGGGPLYPAGKSEWTAVSASKHHYLRATIDGCMATFEAVDVSGVVFDTHALDRCAQALDAAPPTVRFASPAAGATVSGPTAVSVDAADDVAVEKVDLWIDGALFAIDTTPPYTFAWDPTALPSGTHTLQARACDIDGNRVTTSETVTAVAPAASTAPEIVIRAADVPASSIVGDWVPEADNTAAMGVRLRNPNRNAAKAAASAAPANYFEVTFNAVAGTPYHLWIRLQAEQNSYNNDSVSVQFDGAIDGNGAPLYRIGTTSAATVILEEGSGAGVHGWGWNDNAYGAIAAAISFERTGTQTMRVQMREDGAMLDQIVISPSTYLKTSPGTLKDDTTVVAR